jgi:hypothetical protein
MFQAVSALKSPSATAAGVAGLPPWSAVVPRRLFDEPRLECCRAGFAELENLNSIPFMALGCPDRI